MKDAYYFSHDSNAKDDPKCVMVIEQLGLEGYGIFWILIETLRDQPGYKYPMSLIPALARRYNSTTQKVEAVIKGYGLFQFTDDEFFFSQSLIERMQHLEYKRQLAVEAGRKSAEKRKLLNSGSTDVQPTFNRSSTSKVKESKVKESKVKESKVKETIKTALDCAIDEFKIFRKSIKKPMTDRAVELLKSNLDKLASDNETKIKILEQSILNGWQGIFALKDTQQSTTYHAPSKKISFMDIE